MSKQRVSLPLLALAAVAAVAAKSPRRVLVRSVRTGNEFARESFGGSNRGSRIDSSRDKGRVGSAVSLWRIPWSGWKDILLRTYSEMNEDRILAVAGGL